MCCQIYFTFFFTWVWIFPQLIQSCHFKEERVMMFVFSYLSCKNHKTVATCSPWAQTVNHSAPAGAAPSLSLLCCCRQTFVNWYNSTFIHPPSPMRNTDGDRWSAWINMQSIKVWEVWLHVNMGSVYWPFDESAWFRLKENDFLFLLIGQQLEKKGKRTSGRANGSLESSSWRLDWESISYQSISANRVKKASWYDSTPTCSALQPGSFCFASLHWSL